MSEQYLKHTLILYYRNNSSDLWETIESLGSVKKWLTQIRMFIVELINSEQGDYAKTVLEQHPDVESVDFDEKVDFEFSSMPSDNALALFGNHRIYSAVRAYEAWDIQKGRPDVIGGVSDSGVDVLHPDLKDAILPNGYLNDNVGGVVFGSFPVAVNPYLVYTSGSSLDPQTFLGAACFFYEAMFDVQISEASKIPIFADAACTTLLPNPVTVTENLVVWVNQECSTNLIPAGYPIDGKLFFVKRALANIRMTDEVGHGTCVTSVIVSKHDTGEGVAGIAPNCKVLPLKVIDYSSTVAGINESFVYATDYGVKAINCSWFSTSPASSFSASIQYAINHNVTVVVGSANYSKNITELDTLSVPATVNGVLVVGGTGAFDGYNNKAYFAVRANKVHISAPATNYMLAQPGKFSGWSSFSYPGAIHRWSRVGTDGTSFAGPMVTGIVLLMHSAALDRNTTLTDSQVKQLLRESANPYITTTDGTAVFDTSTLNTDGFPVGGMGFGLVDACRALRAVRQEIDVRSRKLVGTKVANNVSVQVAELDVKTWGTGISSIQILRDDVLYQTLTPGGMTYKATVSVTFVEAGTRKVHFIATDNNGSVSTSTPIYVDVVASHQPILELLKFPDPENVKEYWSLSTNGSTENRPIVIYNDQLIKAIINRTGTSLVLSNLEIRIDGVLKATFTSISASGGYQSFLVPMTGVTPGFHTISATLNAAGGISETKTYDMVYSIGSEPVIYTKPWEYHNGIFSLPTYIAGDVSTGSGGSGYIQKMALWETNVELDGQVWVTDSRAAYCLDAFFNFQLRIPAPTNVRVFNVFEVCDYTPGVPEWSSATTDQYTISATVSPAVGNEASVDANAPITFASKGSGRLLAGTQITLAPYRTNDDCSIYYRWGTDSWALYTTPITVQNGTLQWYGTDTAGNTEVTHSFAYETIVLPIIINNVAGTFGPVLGTLLVAGINPAIFAVASSAFSPTISAGLSIVIKQQGIIINSLNTISPTLGTVTLTVLAARVIGYATSNITIQTGSISLTGICLGAISLASRVSAPSAGTLQVATLPVVQLVQSFIVLATGVITVVTTQSSGVGIRSPTGIILSYRDIHGKSLVFKFKSASGWI